MSYTMKKKLANKKNYGGKRKLSLIKYLVIHYTGNNGDHDESNANYFKEHIVKASAHYFVDSDSITQAVPDDYVAYSVGGSKYGNCKTTGGGKCYGKCTNSNSISIELCDDVKDGKIYPSAQTIANGLELTRRLMKKYNVPASNVIRHFDVNGKNCPAYWCGTTEKNKKWKTAFHDKLTAEDSDQKGNGEFLVKVLVNELTIRSGAGANTKAVGAIKDKGTYTITEIEYNGTTPWGKLKSGKGYISLLDKYCKRV